MSPEQLAASMPFARAVGVVIDTATADEVTAHLDWAEDRTTAGGAMHGGAFMTLADSAGAVCAFLNLPEGATTTTLTSTTQLLRGVREGTLHARSRPLSAGRTVIVVQTDLTDDAGRLCGQTTQTQAVLPPRG
jgi:uncharacterized protein (TIGR00369 family)